MRYSLKTKFWLWMQRWLAKLYFYSIKKSNEFLIRDNPQYSIGTSSNCYPWEGIWDAEDSGLYSLDDGEPVE